MGLTGWIAAVCGFANVAETDHAGYTGTEFERWLVPVIIGSGVDLQASETECECNAQPLSHRHSLSDQFGSWKEYDDGIEDNVKDTVCERYLVYI